MSPGTYAERMKEICRRSVDAGPRPKRKGKRKARLGAFAVPRGFVPNECRPTHTRIWF